MNNGLKEFKPTSWSIDNKTSIFVITVIITLAGIMAYINLPKEKFPDIVVPQIYVTTIYPGVGPSDIENVVTKPLEKQLKSITGVTELSSTSEQNFSNIKVEFNTDVDVEEAKRKVKDAVDKAKQDLPNDLPNDPSVREVDFSEMPILYINISGDYDLNKLKEYAEDIQDRIESLPEITRVDIIGALDREIQINVDLYKMQASGLSLRDIETAVAYENRTISGGQISQDGVKRSIDVVGEFKDIEVIKNLVIRSSTGASVYLKDIAEIKDDFEDQESYARLNHKPVITLNVIKRSGENLLDASDKSREIVTELQKTKFPRDLNVVMTGDQSSQTRVTLHDLINTIIIGFLLVTILLMFFMGVSNAIFVALSVPLSMCIAFLVMPSIGFSMNMIVMFSFLLALGIVVDDAIVVIENTHRIFDNGKVDIVTAAKTAAGEIFLPVLAGTLTTLAPFFPLAFWGGVTGKFMFFLPITLIITLLASLLVAYIINPVFAVQFMKPHHDEELHGKKKKVTRGFIITCAIFLVIAAVFYAAGFGSGSEGTVGVANFIMVIFAFYLLHHFFLYKVILNFQNKAWPSVQNAYKHLLTWALQGAKPYVLLVGTFFLLVAAIAITILRNPEVEFFPKSDPNFIYVYITLPVGTDQVYTDSITQIVENRVYGVVGEKNPIIESIISNVTIGVSDPSEGERGSFPNKGRIAISFVEFSHRNGQSTSAYLDKIRAAVKDIPGTEIIVDQERNGPPTGKPVNIEISGDDMQQLIATSQNLKRYLDSLQIPGVEELRSDLQERKPELVVKIDRERANREGISTAQIGSELRTAVFGKEVSKFRDANDEYPITLRLIKEQRQDIDMILNMKITYRDMNMQGAIRQVPISSVASAEYGSTYGAIKRKDQKRLITLSSNVLGGYNANEVLQNVQAAVGQFNTPEGVLISFTGESEEQQESANFLGWALMVAFGIIFLILVTQFNSLGKPLIILTEIPLSMIGVLLGFSIFNMPMSIVMVGVGIVALAGIVVRNGILLIEFTEILYKERGYDLKTAVIEAGRTRMTPVLLTATATCLGMIPLAVGLNIDFETLFTHGNPHIFFGGDSVAFWGPLSWAMVFGLLFATFLTLVLVPVMYYLSESFKGGIRRRRSLRAERG
ncbi:MAG: efflux RND transporter permease subunit [Chitinophagales bacterium]|nr:efflux RND transporter permease subunit [Chitinophagales bacterium]